MTFEQKAFIQLCKDSGCPSPDYEFRFNKIRRWRVDYYFENGRRRLALEVEGGAWSNGRHVRGTGFIGDIEKYNALTLEGIWLLRVVPKDLLTVKTVEMVKKFLFGK